MAEYFCTAGRMALRGQSLCLVCPEQSGLVQSSRQKWENYQGSAQITLVWHVDDFISTHRSQEAIDLFVGKLNYHYGKTTPLKVHRGDVHEYLGINLDFKIPCKVKIMMPEYVNYMVSSIPGEFTGKASTQASDHLF